MKHFFRVHTSKRANGFTLIELLVTIAIATVLMMVAVPSFIQFASNARLSDAVNNFLLAANAARSSALKGGKPSYLVYKDSTKGWSSGWFVFSDENMDKDFTEGTDIVVINHEALVSEIIVTPASDSNSSANTLANGYLRFDGSGYPKAKNGSVANGSITFANPYRSRKIVFDQSGRLRSCVTGSTGC